jgi:hypothetical protein
LRSLGVNLVRRYRKEIEQVERTGKYSEKPSLAARVFNRWIGRRNMHRS